MNNMQSMADMGRYGDTQVAHVAPGEMIVPSEIMQSNPAMAQGIAAAFDNYGADPNRYMVGSQQNSINPMTGQPEFFLGNLISGIFGGGGGGGIGSILGSILGSKAGKGALSNLALRKLQGKKAGLREALIGGIGGGLMGDDTNSAINNLFGGGGSGEAAADLANIADIADMVKNKPNTNSRPGFTKAAVNALKGGNNDTVDAIANRFDNDKLLGYGKMASSIFPSLKEEDSILGNILSTRGGEALLSGLGAEAFDRLFGKDEPDLAGQRAMRPFGHGNATRINTMRQLAQGGETTPEYYPRRDGGIMPSEGSGTKDDVPAMLTAGEFVLTKDAINGLGNGNQQEGIARAYSMMNNLERKSA